MTMVPWHDIDTVLLDMDGTLLDLNYDNVVWNQLLPRHYSARHALDEAQARETLMQYMRGCYGQIEFYCLDRWAEFTALDIVAMHEEATHLIRYRPTALEFLRWLAEQRKQRVLVTNAHRDSLAVKNRHSALLDELDGDVSAHDYGLPKESRAFWETLQRELKFDPARALFIDDNQNVLDAARDFGIAHLLTIAQPDSAQHPRSNLTYPALDTFHALMTVRGPV